MWILGLKGLKKGHSGMVFSNRVNLMISIKNWLINSIASRRMSSVSYL